MTNVGWNLVLFRAATFKYIFKYGEKKSLPKKFKYGLSNFCDRGEEKACPSQIQMEIIETKPEVLDWSRHKTYGKGRKRSQIFWCFRDQISPNMKQFEKNFKNVLWRVFSNDRPEQENTQEKWLCEQIWISSSSSWLYWLTSESSQRRSPKRWLDGGPCSSSGGFSTSDSGSSRGVGGPHSCSVTGGGGPNSLTGAQGPYWLTF